MSELDPDLAQKLRELSEQRVRTQIASAKARRAQQDNTRREFAANRNAGLRSRHAARKARLDLITYHQEKTMPETTTRRGRIHTDQQGNDLEIQGHQHKTTGKGSVSISEAVDATDAYWSFTTDVARKIASDLIEAADLADAAEAKFTSTN